jgi:tetratricopeptide (TPR) repeat protein/tRNA A-37 threonylcarbamoyl transferase component Bud32
MSLERTPLRVAPNAPLPDTRSGERPLDCKLELAPGTLLAGKYRIKAVLGRGGFATVYDAEQIAFARHVALKVLHRTDVTPHVLIERFAREVRISALVRHPNVLEVYDAGVLDDGSPFLAMEKIDGPTLHELLGSVKVLPLDQLLELAAQLLAALVAIGAQGIIHRDIKPENLMLARAPGGGFQLKLVDFGIALVREERIGSRLTAHGALVGTPQYMAPEQLRSEITDARVDLYATGVVLYQALTGALPHDAADLSSLTLKVLTGKWQPVRAQRPDCPRSLARLVERALSAEPSRRFASAASMLSELEACRAEQRGVRAPRASQPQSGERYERVLPASRLGRAGLLVLALLVAGALQTGVAAVFRRGFGGMFQAGGVAASERSAEAQRPAAREVALPPRPAADPPGAAADRQSELSSAPDVRTPAPPAVSAGSAPGIVEAPAPVAQKLGEPSSERGSGVRSAAPAPDQVLRARALTRRGLSLYLHADLEAAYAAYRKATQLAPDDAVALRALGLLASQLGRTQEARRALARYLELSPDAPDADLMRARMKALHQSVDERALVRSEPAREPPPAPAPSAL